MPFASEAQRRAMYAAQDGNSTLGIPKAAAQSFIKHSKGEPLPTVMHSTGTKSKLQEEMRKRRAQRDG
jgi:hypothetical protein